MDQATIQRRAEIARRLKAARWIAGDVQRAKGKKGKPHKVGWKARQLSARDLVQRSPLAENGWTADKVGRIERMERHAGPMELEALARALGMPGLFEEGDEAATRFAAAARREAQRRGEHPGSASEAPHDEDATDAGA